MFYREPIDLIIQIETSLLGQLIYYWAYYGSPCDLILQKAKTEGLSAVRLRMENPDTASLVFVLVERLRIKMYDKNKKAIQVSDFM